MDRRAIDSVEQEVRGGVLRDSSGNPAHAIGVAMDATQRKNLFEALSRANRAHKTLSEGTVAVVRGQSGRSRVRYVPFLRQKRVVRLVNHAGEASTRKPSMTRSSPDNISVPRTIIRIPRPALP